MEVELLNDKELRLLICDLINTVSLLQFEVKELKAENAALKLENQELRDRLKLNSSNSSQPPSQDVFVKPKSLRPKSDKKVGGQPGHEGHFRPQSENPDQIVKYSVENCQHCGQNLSETPVKKVVKRQVWDLPEKIPFVVVEHQAEVKKCSCCGQKTQGVFPENVTSYLQYGEKLQAMGVFLHAHHGLPYERAAQTLETLFGVRLSVATLEAAQTRTAARLTNLVEQINAYLQKQDVLHADETGGRVAGKNHWVHVLCNAVAVHYVLSEKRGQEGMKDHLDDYAGILVHDHWASYFTFDEIDHAICNAHILRELTFCNDVRGCAWAGELKNFLQTTYREAESAKKEGLLAFSDEKLAEIETKFTEIVEKGLTQHPPPDKIAGQRGKPRNSKERNLLNRLHKHKMPTLRFAFNFRIPFDNNQAERDVRMFKVILKIAGCFRTRAGAENHLTIRSFLNTCKKNSLDLIDSLIQAFQQRFQWNF
jgi:transposase